MKKIGVLTINDNTNYGNRLQNYAVQEVLKSLGFSVETIINNTPFKVQPIHEKQMNGNKITKIMKKFQFNNNMSFRSLLNQVENKLWRYVRKKKIKELKIKRFENFKKFSLDYINETEFSITNNNIPFNLGEEYDFFITGSDQVWNPSFRHVSGIDFLTFAPKMKRISFSPSFGISEIPSEYLDKYKLWISEIHRISVREMSGVKIIKDLTNRDAQLLVDPTLMLSKKQWLKIAKESPSKPKYKYLLTYFLGEISQEEKNNIKKIAKIHKLKIVNLVDIKDGHTYVAGPSEFIDYIQSASMFCTDSFHGCVFSILMETPFIAFERNGNHPSMNSRIDTLLTTFNLKSRLSQNIIMDNHVLEMDFSPIQTILTKEQNKTLRYLSEALLVEQQMCKVY